MRGRSGIIIITLIGGGVEITHPGIAGCGGIFPVYNDHTAVIWIVETIPGVITVIKTEGAIVSKTTITGAVTHTDSDTNPETGSVSIAVSIVIRIVIRIVIVKIRPAVRVLSVILI